MTEVLKNKEKSVDNSLALSVLANTVAQALNVKQLYSYGNYGIIAFQWGLTVVFTILLIMIKKTSKPETNFALKTIFYQLGVFRFCQPFYDF